METHELRQLIEAHGAALSLYARQWCRAPDDALQEAFIELVRQDVKPVHPVAWLYKTVRRRAMNLDRAERRRVKHHRQATEQAESWFLPPDDTMDEPLDLELALVQLSALDREIVVARIWGEMSLQQVADLVGLSTSSVHRRYHQALAQMERILETRADKTEAKDEPRSSII